jgi:hypothetical protein
VLILPSAAIAVRKRGKPEPADTGPAESESADPDPVEQVEPGQVSQ